jgi:hypothetical protein
MSVLATIEPANLTVDAGQETSLVVRVRNRGSIVDQFDIHIVGPTAGWAVVDPPSLKLFPDKEGEARVTFRPPRAPEPNADTYPFGVAVRAAADPTAATVEEGHIVVAPFVQLASQVAPQTSRGSMSGTHVLTVRNIGNAVAEVTVTASDPDQLLNFDVAPARVGLRPGGSGAVRATVKPKSTFFMGGAKRVPFQLQIDEPNAGSYQVPATLEQRPLIPGWTKVAFGLAVAAIAAVLVLPRMLGIDLAGNNASPSAVAIASPTAPPITAPPVTAPPITAPPATEGPTPTPGLGNPDTITAAGDKTTLTSDIVTLICAPKNPPTSGCRKSVADRIVTIISNLQGKASGAKMVSFGTFPTGTLPVTATWKTWHYPYSSADGTKGNLTSVAIDLAPALVGAPAYALVQDETGQRFTFTVAASDAQLLLNEMYLVTPPLPPPAPDPGGAGTDYTPIYIQPIGSICATLADCVIVFKP